MHSAPHDSVMGLLDPILCLSCVNDSEPGSATLGMLTWHVYDCCHGTPLQDAGLQHHPLAFPLPRP